MRWEIHTDDVLRLKRTGETFVVARAPYTYRFMEAEDHDMVAAGMGEYAGMYGTAVDITSTVSGQTYRRKIGSVRERFENLTQQGETEWTVI